MTRKPETHASQAASKATAHLKGLRTQIDRLDLQILKLVNDRAELANEIGKHKETDGSGIFSPAREEEVLQNVVAANKGPLDDVTIRAIYREVMSGSRAMQRKLKVAFLGPEYSYSYLATVERFGQDIEFVRVGSIAAVFEDVNRGHAEFGVVPLENSTDGRVADTLDMFMRLPQLKICAEIRMQIHHNLLANCDQMEIRRVYSKGQALSQCRNWLSKNLSHASLHEVSSTADAARLALTEPGAAAVASRQAAVRYGLRILSTNIEDAPDNETRFVVIGLQAVDRTGKDKTSIMFKVPHNPGSLVDALTIFKANKVNMTWIESFPSREGKPEHVFFVDFEGHVDDPKTKKALSALEAEANKVIVLGSYPMAPLSMD
ncbi:MAG: prephenate dehydratase [Gemmataceae bacterium]